MSQIIELFCSLFREGGWVLYPIFAVSLLAFYIGTGKVLHLKKIDKARKYFLTALDDDAGASFPMEKHTYEPYYALAREIREAASVSPQRLTNVFREFLASVGPDLEQGFSTMSACVSIAPLLGLLGTISGMNRMFSVITDVGLGSPSLMAGGISVALESALTGLSVAVASMFFHNYLFNKKNACMHHLMKDGERIVHWAARRRAAGSEDGDFSV